MKMKGRKCEIAKGKEKKIKTQNRSRMQKNEMKLLYETDMTIKDEEGQDERHRDGNK
jgi:hypothetical protein